ncbi:protein PET117 [Aspergillus stella-maris]|uniref:protein PET117 n=1 Tax=Aspergillus stella-maris TaxID=1810926 RepID=UPI003CCCF749
MSRASKLTLAGTGLVTAGIVYFVHWSQEQEKASMHQGVIRDMEKQRIQLERKAEFEMQRKLEEEYLKLQKVSPSTDGPLQSPGGGQTPSNQGS